MPSVAKLSYWLFAHSETPAAAPHSTPPPIARITAALRRPAPGSIDDAVVALDERDRDRLATAAFDGEVLGVDLLAGRARDERVRARIDLGLR